MRDLIATRIGRWIESQPDEVLLNIIQQEILSRISLEQKIKLADLLAADIQRNQQDSQTWADQARRALEVGHGR